MRRKLMITLLTMTMTASLFVGCGNNETSETPVVEETEVAEKPEVETVDEPEEETITEEPETTDKSETVAKPKASTHYKEWKEKQEEVETPVETETEVAESKEETKIDTKKETTTTASATTNTTTTTTNTNTSTASTPSNNNTTTPVAETPSAPAAPSNPGTATNPSGMTEREKELVDKYGYSQKQICVHNYVAVSSTIVRYDPQVTQGPTGHSICDMCGSVDGHGWEGCTGNLVPEYGNITTQIPVYATTYTCTKCGDTYTM